MAGTWNVAYWDGEMWQDTSTLVDTTATLTTNGYLTFSSSVGLAKLSYKYGLLLYWYQVDLYGFSGGSLSEITLRTEMQPINDIWDGVELSVTGWYRNDEGLWYDDTLNVYTNDYDSTNDLTYSDISILNGTDYVIAGFPQRMIGVHLYLPTGLVNTQDDVSLEVSYWNGANWVVLPSIVDGTSIDYTMTLGKSGVITWPDPGEALEYTTTIYNDVPMYYYKIESSAAPGRWTSSVSRYGTSGGADDQAVQVPALCDGPTHAVQQCLGLPQSGAGECSDKRLRVQRRRCG